jgi:hypothetical protein
MEVVMQHTGEPLGKAGLSVSRFGSEPTLADLFSDPITYGLMAADHVDYFDVHTLILRTRHFAVMPGRNPDYRPSFRHQLGLSLTGASAPLDFARRRPPRTLFARAEAGVRP